MAKLPAAIDMQGPNGRVASGQSVDFSSLGNAIQGAAQTLSRFDEARKKADDQVASRELEVAQQSWSLDAGLRAEAYDGRDPGFAARELAAFDAHMAPLLAREDIADGVRDSLTRQSRDLRARVGAQFIAVETQTRGRRTAADRDAADQAAALRALMAFQEDFDPREDARRLAWDGATPGYAEGLMADFTASQEKALADLPAPVAERLKPMLLSRQVTLQAQALAAEGEGRDAGTMATVAQGLQGLVNRARREPALLARLPDEMAPILAAAPAALRTKLATETRKAAADAAITNRIETGDHDAVETEINSGAYDWMDPRQLERARDAIRSAKATGVIEDAQAAADLEAAIPADLRNILKGGQPDRSLVERARLMGGEVLKVKVETDQEAALNVRPLMARLRTMTPDQAVTELEALQAKAGDAVGARTMEMAGGLIQQDRSLRTDGAAWSMTPVGPGDRVGEEVRSRFRAFTTSPTPETAQAYALASWNAQRSGGIQNRRVLDTNTAEAWVAGLDAAGAPADALAGLAQRTALFGNGFQPAVLRDLTMAGLKSNDLGALTHYASSPVRLTQYVRGRALKPNEAVPEKAGRESLDSALNTALAPYMRAIGTDRGGTATTDAAKTMAYGLVSRGSSIADAVRTATAPMVEGYDFVDGWALPKSAGADRGRVRTGAREAVQSLIRDQGAGLFAPPSTRMTPEQSRRVYADQVREHATWRNLADDTGMELVMPNAQGRPVRVKDAAGADMVRTWTQLERTRPTQARSGRFGYN